MSEQPCRSSSSGAKAAAVVPACLTNPRWASTLPLQIRHDAWRGSKQCGVCFQTPCTAAVMCCTVWFRLAFTRLHSYVLMHMLLCQLAPDAPPRCFLSMCAASCAAPRRGEGPRSVLQPTRHCDRALRVQLVTLHPQLLGMPAAAAAAAPAAGASAYAAAGAADAAATADAAVVGVACETAGTGSQRPCSPACP